MQRLWKARRRGGTSGESGLKPSLNQGGSFLTTGSLTPSDFCIGWETDFTASCLFLAVIIPWPPAAAPLGKAVLSAMLGDAITPLLEAGSSFESAASSEQSTCVLVAKWYDGERFQSRAHKGLHWL